jgi:hypothetical protein
MTNQYGIRWIEFDRHSQAQKLERFFKTEEARAEFAEEIEDRAGFVCIVAWRDPQVLH